MTNPTEPDRRQSFRIEDRALLDLVPLTDGLPADGLNRCFTPSSGFQLLSELQQLDQQLQHQLFKLTDNNPALASALQLLNRKLERLALHATDTPTEPQLQTITLSEGGLSILRPQPLAPQRDCALRLRLLPGGYALQSRAQVAYCHKINATSYRIGLIFVDLAEAGRDLIARHILEQQATSRRHQRQQLELGVDQAASQPPQQPADSTPPQ